MEKPMYKLVAMYDKYSRSDAKDCINAIKTSHCLTGTFQGSVRYMQTLIFNYSDGSGNYIDASEVLRIIESPSGAIIETSSFFYEFERMQKKCDLIKLQEYCRSHKFFALVSSLVYMEFLQKAIRGDDAEELAAYICTYNSFMSNQNAYETIVEELEEFYDYDS